MHTHIRTHTINRVHFCHSNGIHKFSRIHIEQNAEYRIRAHVCASATRYVHTHTHAAHMHIMYVPLAVHAEPLSVELSSDGFAGSSQPATAS